MSRVDDVAAGAMAGASVVLAGGALCAALVALQPITDAAAKIAGKARNPEVRMAVSPWCTLALIATHQRAFATSMPPRQRGERRFASRAIWHSRQSGQSRLERQMRSALCLCHRTKSQFVMRLCSAHSCHV